MPDPLTTRLDRLGLRPKAKTKTKKAPRQNTHVLEEPPKLKSTKKSTKKVKK